tara:strand:+ start:472 stop:687 length:216 start_codon:yes stop_codon:yes gene_type:complete
MVKICPKTYIWNTFLQECEQMMEAETGQTYQWKDVYPTKTQKQDILNEIFLKHASLEDIVLRNKVYNGKYV